VRGFRRDEHGGAAIEAAFAVMVLVTALATLMELVQARHAEDRLSRAAHAAARTLALNPGGDSASVACDAIRRELRLAESFDCAKKWTVTVDLGVSLLFRRLCEDRSPGLFRAMGTWISHGVP